MWKIATIVLVLTLVGVGGFGVWQGRAPVGDLSSRPQGDVLSATEAQSITIDQPETDWGQIPINSGIVTREFMLTNGSGKAVILRKIATSCMCTTGAVEFEGKTTKFFGMEMHTDKNPPVNIEIGAGKAAKVIVKFDPLAHGPEGVGPFDRAVGLFFDDPIGVREVKFKGEVVK